MTLKVAIERALRRTYKRYEGVQLCSKLVLKLIQSCRWDVEFMRCPCIRIMHKIYKIKFVHGECFDQKANMATCSKTSRRDDVLLSQGIVPCLTLNLIGCLTWYCWRSSTWNDWTLQLHWYDHLNHYLKDHQSPMNWSRFQHRGPPSNPHNFSSLHWLISMYKRPAQAFRWWNVGHTHAAPTDPR